MDVYIIGCGGNSKVIIDICELKKYNVVGLFDDKYDGNQIEIYKKYKLIGIIDDVFKYSQINIINSIGDNKLRYKIYKQFSSLDFNWINCIHPNTYISSTAKIGIGNIICYGAFLNCDILIGNFNLINTYSIIEHDCLIGNFNHIAPKTTLCGTVSIGNLNLLGTGSTFIPNTKIGNKNKIGAMTVIIKEFSDNNIIVGIPGKKINLSNHLNEQSQNVIQPMF